MRTIRTLLSTLLCLAGLVALPLTARPASAQQAEGFLAGVSQIAAGDGFSCARLNTGEARCWGDNYSGQVGDGTVADERHLPTTVLRPDGGGPLTGVAQVDTGFEASCARLANHQVRCWGDNSYGNLGDGTTDDHALPVAVTVPGGARLTGVRQLQVSDGFACALLVDRRVRCWGENEDGNLGDGSTTERHRAVLVRLPGGSPLAGVTQLSAGRDHACAVVRGGQVRCWGDNGFGNIGDGTSENDRLRPRTVLNGSGTAPLVVRQVAAGDGVTCAVLANRQARCWGDNQYGQLGRGLLSDGELLPVPVLATSGPGRLGNVVALNTAGDHICARLTGDQLRCWGRNVDGAIGDGTVGTDRTRPTVVLDPTGTIPLGNVRQVAGGGIHTCARLANGQARCWGDNGPGAVGDGTSGNDRLLPVVVQL
jgi:alpha-tubulin suppressor-like RCC1 family protein